MSKCTVRGAVFLFLMAFTVSSGATIIRYGNDTEYLASGFTKFGGGYVRWGNGAGNGDWEYSVVDASDVPVGSSNPMQYDWGAGHNTHTPRFTYDSSGAISLSIHRGAPTSTGGIAPGANALLIRAKADTLLVEGERLGRGQLANLFELTVRFDSGGRTYLGNVLGDGDANYLGLVDSRLAGGFSVGAYPAYLDGADRGRGSLPAYQFKVGAMSTVPEPATAVLIACGLVALGAAARRSAA